MKKCKTCDNEIGHRKQFCTPCRKERKRTTNSTYHANVTRNGVLTQQQKDDEEVENNIEPWMLRRGSYRLF